MDSGEEIKEAAVREIEEEVGISLNEENSVIFPFFLYEAFHGPTKSGKYAQILIVYYLVEGLFDADEVEVKVMEEEVCEFKWVEEEELRAVMLRNKGREYGIGKGELEGIYPNEDGFGIAEGHCQALTSLFGL